MKRLLGAVFALAALAAAPSAHAAFTTTDQVVMMDDGAGIATTLYVPAGVASAPAVIAFHGLGGNRQSVALVARTLADRGYVVLAPDFRGHGQSGGLFTGLGVREIQDVRNLRAWLPAHAPVRNDAVG